MKVSSELVQRVKALAKVNSIKKRAKEAMAILVIAFAGGGATGVLVAERDSEIMQSLGSGKSITQLQDPSTLSPQELEEALSREGKREWNRRYPTQDLTQKEKDEYNKTLGELEKLNKELQKQLDNKNKKQDEKSMMEMIMRMMMDMMNPNSKRVSPPPQKHFLPSQTESFFEKDKEWESHPTVKKFLQDAEQIVIKNLKQEFGEEKLKEMDRIASPEQKNELQRCVKQDSLGIFNQYLEGVLPAAGSLKMQGNDPKLMGIIERTLEVVDKANQEIAKKFGDRSVLRHLDRMYSVPPPPPSRTPSAPKPKFKKDMNI